MPELKPAYLIHGDDHGAIAERRAGLRALAEREQGGGASVELLEGEAASPAGVAAALATMTLAVGRRVIIVEGVERWREAEIEKQLAPALAQLPPETTLALFAREEARAKAPASLHQLVKRAGGQVVAQSTVKPWELAKWAREQATRLGLSLDAAAAKALVAQVGERQQRLLRELEKLALEAAGGADGGTVRIGAQDIEARAAHSNEWRAYALADALVGHDAPAAIRTYIRLRQQGERLSGLTYLMASRLRDALAVAQRLQAGESVAEVKRTLRMPARAAERFVADVARSDSERLRRALVTLAQLELDSRGGPPLSASRSALAGLDEDTLALHAIERIAAAS
ncbi:MAG TPA: DNA polymerase III subunit delta [Solirubrobacteraceae bacterium]|nr:DNA polymerase III subunit delta [Solirubrobacteraceae bacterium]